MPTLIISIQYNIRVPSQWIKQGRKKKKPTVLNWKGRCNTILIQWWYNCDYGENSEDPIEILLELWNKFNKAMW